jgi:ferredoxin
MKRSIVHINEDKCNGCGLCIPACHEGAIRLVNGKARLAEDALCDGLGACLGECPQGAITIEERAADSYDEVKALDNIMAQGPEAVRAHLKHLADHGQHEYLAVARSYLKEKEAGMPREKEHTKTMACGCPGSMERDFRRDKKTASAGESVAFRETALEQWPVQLKLLNPRAPFFAGRELVVSADCVPFTYGNFHQKFLKGKSLAVFCPKLDDDLEGYVEKLAEIIRSNDIPSATAVKMEVPCCGGTLKMLEEAVRRSGRNIIIKEYTVSLQGEII